MFSFLFFEARAGFDAAFDADDGVVGAGLGHGAVAPAMGRMAGLIGTLGESLVGEGGDEHFLGAQMFANVSGSHNQLPVLMIGFS
jgi:hypothetical protein